MRNLIPVILFLFVTQRVISQEIIYFSTDNGITWEDRSMGLPPKTSIGLGGVAVSTTLLGVATKENGVYLFKFQDNIWTKIPTDHLIIKNNIGAMTFHQGKIFVGTQFGGVFFSADNGKNWINLNTGLDNLTVRKLVEIDNRLYAGTNAGLYSYNEPKQKWELEYGNNSLQVNGITEYKGSIYIGTNQGAFATLKNQKDWKQLLADYSLHNIGSDENTIYAMTYNELFSSADNGNTWQSQQYGLPKDLYTFNVVKNANTIFAAQWNGIYYKTNSNEIWKLAGKGIPENYAINNLNSFNGILIAITSERQLKTGLTTDE